MRILLADDHAVVRRGLLMVLEFEKDFEIVGEASNGVEAIRLARDLQPDLVLMDLRMPEMGGALATRQIKESQPDVKVLILTGVDIDDDVAEALRVGADGYLLKNVSPAELIGAIRAVGAGEAYLQPAVTRLLMEKLAPGARGQGSKRGMSAESNAQAEKSPSHPALTPRECQVLKLMATSATYREIAAQLVVSEETVRSHTKSILAKLGQPNRTQAVLVALREGLVTLD